MVPSGERINQHCVFADTFFSTITGTGKPRRWPMSTTTGFVPRGTDCLAAPQMHQQTKAASHRGWLDSSTFGAGPGPSLHFWLWCSSQSAGGATRQETLLTYNCFV